MHARWSQSEQDWKEKHENKDQCKTQQEKPRSKNQDHCLRTVGGMGHLRFVYVVVVVVVVVVGVILLSTRQICTLGPDVIINATKPYKKLGLHNGSLTHQTQPTYETLMTRNSLSLSP